MKAIRPILIGYLIACAICVGLLNGCAKLPVTGERGLIYDVTHPMSHDEWAESEDGSGGQGEVWE